LDEPLSALDAKVRTHLRQEIKQLQRRLAVTTIMVTHDQEEALTMADRIVVMNHGIIEQIGSPEDIYAAPASEFVAQFIGTMNFVNVVVASANQGTHQGGVLEFSQNSLRPRESARLAFRPEDVEILEKSDEHNRDKVLGKVVSAEYLGAFLRVTIAPEGWESTLLADISTDIAARFVVEAGGDVAFRLPPEKILAYQESE
jgi:iron(III) transport system ATP-binding protein